MTSPTFEWDPQKGADNLKTHRIGFDEAATVFHDPLAKILDDPDHSAGESRAIILGHSLQGHLLLVSFVERGSNIRLISARRATRRERRDYEEASKDRQ